MTWCRRGSARLGVAICLLLLAVGLRAQSRPSGAPLATPPEITIQDTPTGPVFADRMAYTLYVTERDTEPHTSTCFGPCAKEWPPVRAEVDATPFGEWTLVPRPDGAAQWAYRGRPLYRYRHEARPRWAEAHSRVWYIATTDPFPALGGRVRYGRHSLVTADRVAVEGVPGGITGRITATGPVYADWNGMTLYTRDEDDPCVGPCLDTWSPLAAPMAAVADGPWTVLVGPGGTRVWAHRGQVVYRCRRDEAPGDRRCEDDPASGRALILPPEAAR